MRRDLDQGGGGGVVGKMVSRRKILSRSRDDLNTEQPAMQEEEEDVWYQRDKLYKVSNWGISSQQRLALIFV